MELHLGYEAHTAVEGCSKSINQISKAINQLLTAQALGGLCPYSQFHMCMLKPSKVLQIEDHMLVMGYCTALHALQAEMYAAFA